MSNITISLCMIVKDEEDVIERCLNSVKDVVDEIIIVDTGSTDKTKEIVSSFGATIYDFQWVDDFAKARNFSFSKANKDYILWLDADDFISKDSLEEFKKLKENFDKEIDSVTMNYLINGDTKANCTEIITRNRLVKRSRNFKWFRSIHEYLYISGDNLNIINSEIDIIHGKIKKITDRNLKMLEKKMNLDDEIDSADIFYYAEELYNRNRFDEAVINYKKFLESNCINSELTHNKIRCCKNLALYYYSEMDFDYSFKYLFKTFEFDTPKSEICCLIGNIFMKKDNWENAAYWYEMALKNNYLTDYTSHTWKPHICLCVVYYKLNNLDKAIYHNEEAAKYVPNNKDVINNRSFFNKIQSYINNK